MAQAELSAACRKSPLKRAKLAGLERDAQMTRERADEV